MNRINKLGCCIIFDKKSLIPEYNIEKIEDTKMPGRTVQVIILSNFAHVPLSVTTDTFEKMFVYNVLKIHIWC